jgi:phosphohistidine phosphatase
MNVYIFRHGHSESKASSPDKTDEGRRLVEEGKEQVEWTCAEAKKLGVVPTVIMSSPRVRGKQTAEMTGRLMNPKARVVTDGSLEPQAKGAEIYGALSKFKKDDSVILVAHLPNLGHLLVDMLNWDSVWKNLDFENGAMARIDFKGLPKPKSGNLIWLISPTRSASFS